MQKQGVFRSFFVGVSKYHSSFYLEARFIRYLKLTTWPWALRIFSMPTKVQMLHLFIYTVQKLGWSLTQVRRPWNDGSDLIDSTWAWESSSADCKRCTIELRISEGNPFHQPKGIQQWRKFMRSILKSFCAFWKAINDISSYSYQSYAWSPSHSVVQSMGSKVQYVRATKLFQGKAKSRGT